jgi:8-oxo-dGTP pyrophosphatase MutT (NUDIX family)
MSEPAKTPNPRAVVSAIIEKDFDGILKIFVQTRWKPEHSPTYLGVLEIPAGGIDGYEDVYTAITREVKEETGLDVVEFLDDTEKTGPLTNRPGDTSQAFTPFVCQQMLSSNGGLPWVGFVFRCRVTGTAVHETNESKDLRWLSLDELETFITEKPEEVFGLQYASLRYYLDWHKKQA